MKKWLAVIMMVGLMAMALVGCSSKEEPSGATTSTENQTQTETQSPGGNDLNSIIEKASQAKAMSFDLVSTITDTEGDTVTTNTKFYVSGEKNRIETEAMGMKMIIISNAQGESYLYNPIDKTALKMTAPETGTELPSEWAQEDLLNYEVVGEEKMDGHDCLVLTVKDKDADEDEYMMSKMWVRKDIGMPVRTEGTIEDSNKIVVEYKNYNIGEQPADLFEIPAGTEIIDMPGMSEVNP